MNTLKHTLTTGFPYPALTIIAELIEYEGPLLSLLQNPAGEFFLYKWCDNNETLNRWLLIQISDAQLHDLFKQQLSLLSIFQNPHKPVCYLVDIDQQNQIAHCALSLPEHIPPDYLPEADSYYTERPRFVENNYFNISLIGDWNLHQVGELSINNTLFIDLIIALTSTVQQRFQDELIPLFKQNIWGGTSRGQLYQELRAFSERHQLATMRSINIEPPGKLVMQLDKQVKQTLIKVVTQLQDRQHLSQLYAQANDLIKDLNRERDSPMHFVHPQDLWVSNLKSHTLEAPHAQRMKQLIDDMSTALNLTEEAQNFFKACGSYFLVFQILRAVMRSLKKLDRFVLDGQIGQLGETLF